MPMTITGSNFISSRKQLTAPSGQSSETTPKFGRVPPTTLLLLGGGGRCLGLGLVGGGRCRILGSCICGLLLGLVREEPALVNGPDTAAVRRLAGGERYDAHPKGGASASGQSGASGGAEHGSVELVVQKAGCRGYRMAGNLLVAL